MGKIWVLMLLASITTLLFHDPGAAVTAMVNGSHAAVSLTVSLAALYAFWLGFFSILEKTGISDKLAKLLRPSVNFLFPGADEETRKYITMNMSANMLGLGNAATPMAIRAIGSMEHDNGKASLNMIMMVVISATSFQLLPSTVIGMRATHGSANPSDFLFPCMIATGVSTATGIILVKLLGLFRKKFRRAKPLQTEGKTPLRGALSAVRLPVLSGAAQSKTGANAIWPAERRKNKPSGIFFGRLSKKPGSHKKKGLAKRGLGVAQRDVAQTDGAAAKDKNAAAYERANESRYQHTLLPAAAKESLVRGRGDTVKK